MTSIKLHEADRLLKTHAAPHFACLKAACAEARKGVPGHRLDVDGPPIVIGPVPSGSDVWSNGHWARVPESHPSGVISTLKNHAVKRRAKDSAGGIKEYYR